MILTILKFAIILREHLAKLLILIYRKVIKINQPILKHAGGFKFIYSFYIYIYIYMSLYVLANLIQRK